MKTIPLEEIEKKIEDKFSKGLITEDVYMLAKAKVEKAKEHVIHPAADQ